MCKITKATKKANPPKFYVNKKWYLKDMLLKSEKVDEISEKLVAEREEAQRAKDELKEKQHLLKRKQELAKQVVAAKTGRRSRRSAALKGRAKALAAIERGRKIDKLLK